MTKIAFLYATFPRPTETFVRRELSQLQELGLTPAVFSIWKGARSWQGLRINLFPLSSLLRLIFWIPYWAWKRPTVFKLILSHLWKTPCPNLQNWNETFLGLAFALIQAKSFKQANYERLHAVWATMPATAALGISLLTDVRFSMGAHAYDVFRNGGDWLLALKLKSARLVRTSSQSTANRLNLLGTTKEQLVLIHRSLKPFPSRGNFELVQKNKLSLLSVGRLVEKKGYFLLLKILQALKFSEVPFTLNMIGGGPLENEIRRQIQLCGLDKNVNLLGHMNEPEIEKFYLQSDALLFTGIVSSNGDRDGIPNVIPEAMANGLLVLASNRAGSPEAFTHGEAGFTFDPYHQDPWVNLLRQFFDSPDRFLTIRKHAHLHAASQFSAKVNCQKLKSLFE